MALNDEKLMDEVGWKLLEALQENARLTFSELGRRVGLSSPAAAERVRRMEEAGIITGYRAEVNLEKLGLPIAAFIRINTAGKKSAQLGAFACSLSEVMECHRVTGSDCFMLRANVASVAHLEDLMDRLLPYGNVTTCIVVSSPLKRRLIDSTTIPSG
ncbi:Lrp/AsnC family transcriptional regulator [Gloeobacter violaceus]|uniref:AsnC family transcriptional regulatory protein n=1 Tax=Gloeobacter violaceus (strain ATCC 29082 / PCC 7421) TaxID=251221 RepID=Q7NH56_GLOVI|nr:Lrp/AsnC family transcriptional regulator [Gloeobacter violaceus]BAC90622.1 AsnC family transcriptional regulatory protein [Gloeobacter violaceus PCC 7421]